MERDCFTGPALFHLVLLTVIETCSHGLWVRRTGPQRSSFFSPFSRLRSDRAFFQGNGFEVRTIFSKSFQINFEVRGEFSDLEVRGLSLLVCLRSN